MRVLIDIGHPAHVHLFKHLAWELIKDSHEVLFTCRDREFVVYLLSKYCFKYDVFGKQHSHLFKKIVCLFLNEFHMLLSSLRFKPDIFVSHGSILAGHSSFILRKPHIALEDTFNMEQVRLSLPFSNVVLTGDFAHKDLGKKEIRYPGYHELAYLHPDRYQPDISVLEQLGIAYGERYVIVRFVAWKASHDVGHKGMNIGSKLKLVNELSKYVRVFITSENSLPPELSKYQIAIDPDKIHDAIYYAHAFIGESATMASESAMLGVPAVFINNSQLGSINDQANYGLIHTYYESVEGQDLAICNAIEMAMQDDVKVEYCKKKEMMLSNMIDVTAFIVWLVVSYPDSVVKVRASMFNFDRFKYR